MATIFVLGSHDVEMVCIRELLEEAGFLCLQAGNMVTLPNGVQTFVPVGPGFRGSVIARVTFDGAYDVVPLHPDDTYLGVEVAGPWGPAAFDHHDSHPSASLPPSEFMRASSLGQVIQWLAERYLLPDGWVTGHGAQRDDFTPYIHTEMGCWCCGYDRCGYAIHIPPRYVAQAAADHCIAAAFAGQCPGVDLTPGSDMYNEVVLSRRRAFAPDMDENEFLEAVELASATLLHWTIDTTSQVPIFRSFADLTYLDPSSGPIATTGEQYPISAQFLPLVGSMLGIGYIVPILKYTTVKRDDGTVRYVNPVAAYRLGGCGIGTPAGTAPIEWWASEGWDILGCYGPDAARPNNMYANPSRGFGGGTVK